MTNPFKPPSAPLVDEEVERRRLEERQRVLNAALSDRLEPAPEVEVVEKRPGNLGCGITLLAFFGLLFGQAFMTGEIKPGPHLFALGWGIHLIKKRWPGNLFSRGNT